MELSHPARDPNCRSCTSLIGLPCFGHFILWRAGEQTAAGVDLDATLGTPEAWKREVADLERMWRL